MAGRSVECDADGADEEEVSLPPAPPPATNPDGKRDETEIRCGAARKWEERGPGRLPRARRSCYCVAMSSTYVSVASPE